MRWTSAQSRVSPGGGAVPDRDAEQDDGVLVGVQAVPPIGDRAELVWSHLDDFVAGDQPDTAAAAAKEPAERA